MSDQMAIGESARCEVVRPAHQILDLFDPKGHFKIEHLREGKLIGVYEAPNLIVNEGKNRLLDTMFGLTASFTKYETWYIGLVDNAGFTNFQAGDTYDNIDGTNAWDEWQGYDVPATRPSWTQGVAASQVITNAVPVTFTMDTAGTLEGLFLCAGPNAATKGNHEPGTTPNENVLWCGTSFASGTVAVLDNDQLKVTYTITIAA